MKKKAKAVVPPRITFKNYDDLLPLDDLVESPYQTNKHTKEQIENLALLMREDGVRQPIHLAKRKGKKTKVMCFGHGRKEAAKLNGWTHYPVVWQEFKSEDEEFASVQSDNGQGQWSELDFAKINDMLPDFGPFPIEQLGINKFGVDPSDFKEPPEKNDPSLKEPHLNKCPNCGVLLENG